MQVAIFSPYQTVAPHFETELELAQLHLDAGDSVRMLACLGELQNCDFNRKHEEKACEDCRLRRRHGLSFLDKRIRPIPIDAARFPADDGETNEIFVPQFESVKHLKDFYIAEFDIGYAVLSSLVSMVRDPEPDLVAHRGVLERLFRSAESVWRFAYGWIQSHRPDRVYVFNGRFAAMRAILRACQANDIECWIHERGCNKDHYDLFRNHLPHDIEQVRELIDSAWEDADPDERETEGRQWYIDRRQRVETNWKSFVRNQDQGHLPADWNPARRNVAIFCSSDDEFVAIGDSWQNRVYTNQLTGIEQLVNSLVDETNTAVWLRMHPNMKDVQNAIKDRMLGLRARNLTVIAPDDPCDSYELMARSDVVASFGSSVGIEAVFWGKPSVLLGPCFYAHLEGPLVAESHDHAVELIRFTRSPSASINGALRYGYWMQTHGIRFRYFEAESLFHGRFRGNVVFSKPQKHTLPQLFRFRAGKFIRRLVNR